MEIAKNPKESLIDYLLPPKTPITLDELSENNAAFAAE